MQADERQLINDLFERMRSFGPVEKDRDAEALIIQHARQNPDAGYMLVQSVLVQEQALAQQQQRIEELEAQVRQLQSQRTSAAPAAAAGGSFLGGLFGGGGRGSVPSTGRTAPAAAPSGPWGNPNARPMAAQAAPAQPAAGGGFMRSAMATAAGVAGGMLAANAISNMMGGGQHGHAGQQTAGTSPEPSAAEQTTAYDDTNNDPGNYTEPASDTGGGWDSGGDMDI